MCSYVLPFCFSWTVFKDLKTPSPFIEKFPDVEGEGAKAALPDHIYLDCVGFGLGICCLQVNPTEIRSLITVLTRVGSLDLVLVEGGE